MPSRLSITEMFSSYRYVCLAALLAAEAFRTVSGQGNFTMNGTSNAFLCESNLICLGGAHVYTGEISDGSNGFTQVPDNLIGRLSLVPEDVELSSYSSGIAYTREPVRLLDPSTRQAASFNTSFTIDTVMETYNGPYNRSTGDGLVFVISADNATLGSPAKCFGFFNNSGSTDFKSIVVEYDQYQNPGPPIYDISPNHVSIDFSNISWAAAANASDVDVLLWYNLTIYTWVEYSSETRWLEARISNNDSRPVKPLLNYTVDLFDVVEEYMWVGFASGTGSTYSHYYIGDWVFESYGIPTAISEKAKSGGSGHSKWRLIVGLSVGIPGLLVAAIVAVVFVLRWEVSRRFRKRSLESTGADYK